VLVEEARTNLLTYSSDFNNAAWGKTTATVTGNTVAAPDGTTTADRLLEDATAGAQHRIDSANSTTATGVNYTASLHFKQAVGSRNIVLRIAGASGSAWAVFNPSTGAVVASTTSGSNWAVVTANAAQELTGGWFRGHIVVSQTEANGSGFEVVIQLADGSTLTYNGDGTSGVDIFGAQLEAGSFPTSLVPTQASQVTRAADQVSLATSLLPYSQTVGALVTDYLVNNTETGAYRSIAAFKNAGETNASVQIRQNLPTASTMSSDCQTIDTTTQATFAGVAIALGSMRTAYAYKANDFGHSMNGATVQMDVSGSVPSDITKLVITGGPYTIGTGWLKKVKYLPRRATNAELVAFTV